MSPAEEDSVGDVGFAVVSMPLVDVVRFATGRGSITAREPAATIPDGDADPLPFGEQATVPTHVHALAVVVERDTHSPGVTEVPFHSGEGDRVGVTLDPPVPRPALKVLLSDDDPDRRRPPTEHGA